MGGAVPADRLRRLGAQGAVRWDRLRAGLLCATAALLPAGYVLAAGVPLLLVWFAECAALRRPPWERTPVDGILALWVGWVVLSALASPHRDLALGNALLLALGATAGLAPLTGTLRDQEGFRRPLYWAWAAGGALGGLWVVLRVVQGAPRGDLPQLGWNAAGTVLAAASLLGLALAGSGGRRALLLGAAAQALALAGLVGTLSRGAWLGWAAGVLCLAPWLGARARYTVFGAAAAVTLAVAGHPGLRDRALSALEPERNQDRLMLWRASVRMLADHPWFGVGFGAFVREYPKYRVPEDPNVAPPFAHNLPLSLAVETGLPGVALFAALVVRVVQLGLAHATRAPPREALLQGAGLASLAAVMVHQLVDGTLQSFHLGFAFWFLVACVLPGLREEGRRT